MNSETGPVQWKHQENSGAIQAIEALLQCSDSVSVTNQSKVKVNGNDLVVVLLGAIHKWFSI